ncbi:MAG: FAD-dependent thymidylate synthase [Clostridia bacterium]|nr:FAD-dependent thymidylate synthase [Clostridia bacterium]
MQNSSVRLMNQNTSARDAVAAAARISTQQGNALQVYAKSGDTERDLSLIRKVVSSGHTSVLEHQTLTFAFNDVSVMVEQYIIEYRLASFTVKSRRYVDFSDAGFVVPDDLPEGCAKVYARAMSAAFRAYEALLLLNIPKEDARFVFPYSLRSNFIVTANLREWAHIAADMRSGRGSRYAELRKLGAQLEAQVGELYPELISSLRTSEQRIAPLSAAYAAGEAVSPRAILLSHTENPKSVLDEALRFTDRFVGEARYAELVRDARPRELERLHYAFQINGISLACLTHFTRHRMLSPCIPPLERSLEKANYVLPASIVQCDAAREIYRNAFYAQSAALQECLALGLPERDVVYFAASGNVIDLQLDMNARELLHFCALRTCSRAQWEIQEAAVQMLSLAYPTFPELFQHFGPSCAVLGHCPEGRMSCGCVVSGYRALMQKREASE